MIYRGHKIVDPGPPWLQNLKLLFVHMPYVTNNILPNSLSIISVGKNLCAVKRACSRRPFAVGDHTSGEIEIFLWGGGCFESMAWRSKSVGLRSIGEVEGLN